MLNLRDRKTLVYISIACLVFFLASFTPPLRLAGLNILRYPLDWFSSVKSELKALIYYKKNNSENQALRMKLDLLLMKLNDAQEAKLENQRLNQLLELKKEQLDFKVVPARVIGSGNESLASSVIIDKGSASGIKKTNVVISYLGIVGRVMETALNSSQVMLINDSSLSISARDQRSRQEGLVCGTLGNTLLMKYLPKGAEILPGDRIVTSGLTPAYPKGLLIGEVIDVGEDLSGLSSFAIIKPAVNLSSIEEVLVIVK